MRSCAQDVRARRRADAGRRPDRTGRRPAIDGDKVECRVLVGGELGDQQGHQPARRRPVRQGADRQGPRGRQARGQRSTSTTSRFRSCATRPTSRRRARLLRAAGSDARIVAKIERSEAIPRLDEIVLASDAVMVARGDLGVEMGYAELTGLQKHILQVARRHDRVTITATQMMESMIQSPVPTRAEVSDVANAVLDGTDAVMLSAETAVGKYPVQRRRGDGRGDRGRREVPDRAQPRRRALRGPRQRVRAGHRACGDVHREPHGRGGDRRADRVRRRRRCGCRASAPTSRSSPSRATSARAGASRCTAASIRCRSTSRTRIRRELYKAISRELVGAQVRERGRRDHPDARRAVGRLGRHQHDEAARSTA